jgi:hypothetical protein
MPKQTNKISGQNADFKYVEAGGTYKTSGLQRVKHATTDISLIEILTIQLFFKPQAKSCASQSVFTPLCEYLQQFTIHPFLQ